MSSALARAKEQLADRQPKKAVASLWKAEADSRGDLDEARELLEVTSSLRDQVDSRLQGECDELVRLAEASIDRLSQQEHDMGAIAVLWRCQVLGGHGLAPSTGERWDLVFQP